MPSLPLYYSSESITRSKINTSDANYTITLPALAVMVRLALLLCVAVLMLAGEGFGEYIIPYLVIINILIPRVFWRGGALS